MSQGNHAQLVGQSATPAVARPDDATAKAAADKHFDFAWKVHAYICDYIRFADTKAAALIAWCTALITMLWSTKAHENFTGASVSLSAIDWKTTALAWGSAAAFGCLACGIGFAFWSVKPSLWSQDGAKTHSPGYVFWETIRAHGSVEQFRKGLTKMDSAGLAAQTAENTYVLAGIAKRKYKWVDWSIRLGCAGTVLAVVTAIFSH
jgi:Family of unknown function (DUF5706)